MTLFDPETSVIRRVKSGLPSLGSIVVCDLTGEVFAIADACSFHRCAPWCPICLVIPVGSAFDPRIQQAFEPRPGAFALIYDHMASVLRHPEVIRTAVSSRNIPLPSTLAGYVRLRTGRPDMAATLEACFAFGVDANAGFRGPHRSTLLRHLKGFGQLKPRDWCAVGQLAVTLSRSTHHGFSAEAIADSAGLDTRTLRGRVRRYCGCGFLQARRKVGWEWIVESALRLHGYLGAERCADDRSGASTDAFSRSLFG